MGDHIAVTTAPGRRRELVVEKDRRAASPEDGGQRRSTSDVTPPPSEAEQQLREILRRAGPVARVPARRRARTDGRGGFDAGLKSRI